MNNQLQPTQFLLYKSENGKIKVDLLVQDETVFARTNMLYRKEEDRYSKRISVERIEKEGYNLNISRHISTAKLEKKIDLKEENKKLVDIEKDIVKYTKEHNEFLKELGLDLLPT